MATGFKRVFKRLSTATKKLTTADAGKESLPSLGPKIANLGGMRDSRSLAALWDRLRSAVSYGYSLMTRCSSKGWAALSSALAAAAQLLSSIKTKTSGAFKTVQEETAEAASLVTAPVTGTKQEAFFEDLNAISQEASLEDSSSNSSDDDSLTSEGSIDAVISIIDLDPKAAAMAARAAEVASRGGCNWTEADKAAGLQCAQQVQAADKEIADAKMDAWQELSKRLENQKPAERTRGTLGNATLAPPTPEEQAAADRVAELMKAGMDEDVAIEMQGREADAIEWAELAKDPAFAHLAAHMAQLRQAAQAAAAKAKLVG